MSELKEPKKLTTSEREELIRLREKIYIWKKKLLT